MKSLLICLNEVKVWLSKNVLQLIIFGAPKFKEKIPSILAPLAITVKDPALFDQNLNVMCFSDNELCDESPF